jgi:guanylate kinase
MSSNKNHSYKPTLEKIIIISGPSGAGKSTVCAHLLKRFPQKVISSVSETTRPKRDTEQQGRHYIYVSPDYFQKKCERFHFYEWFYLHGNFYGTPRAPLDRAFQKGQIPLLDVDVNGMQRMSRLFVHHLSIFMAPPSIEILRDRILKRKSETDAQLTIRLETAKEELKKQCLFQHVLVNKDLEKTLQKAEDIVTDYLNA